VSLHNTTSRDRARQVAVPGQDPSRVSRLFYRTARPTSTGPVWLIYRDPERKHQVGLVRWESGKLIFETRRDPAKHYARKFCGWGLDVSVLHGLAARGVEIIRIILPSGQCEQADMRAYLDCGHYGNIGPGAQVFLRRRAFHDSAQPTLPI